MRKNLQTSVMVDIHSSLADTSQSTHALVFNVHFDEVVPPAIMASIDYELTSYLNGKSLMPSSEFAKVATIPKGVFYVASTKFEHIKGLAESVVRRILNERITGIKFTVEMSVDGKLTV